MFNTNKNFQLIIIFDEYLKEEISFDIFCQLKNYFFFRNFD